MVVVKRVSLLPDQLDELAAALKQNKARVRTARVGTGRTGGLQCVEG